MAFLSILQRWEINLTPAMLKTAIHFLTPDYQNLKTRTVFLSFFLVSLFIRFPFFFRDYIDLDESTFIVMAQAWLDGNLPYTVLWDLKPPLVFLFFAGIIAVFGKSFIAIRLAGVLVITVSAFFLYKIGQRIHTTKTGFWSGILFIFLCSLFGSLQGVMSEHISMAFFLPALYLLLKKNSFPVTFVSGILLGCSLMTKLNLSYAVLLLSITFLYISLKKYGSRNGLFSASALGIGILCPILFFFLLYQFQGYGEVWWKSVVLASLAYGKIPFSEQVDTLLPILLVTVLLTLFLFWNKKKNVISNISHLMLLISCSLGVLFSFYKVGKMNGHYLIQLHPFLTLFFCSFLFQFKNTVSEKVKMGIFLIFLLIPMESYLEYYAIFRNYAKNKTFYNGEGIEVPKYLKESKTDTRNILFLEYHIGYWLLDKYPLTKATTHPSTLMRDKLFPFMDNPRKTSLAELQYILNNKTPGIIVSKGARIPFNADNKEEVYAYFEEYLAAHYMLLKEIGNADIYKRLE